jgi:hypothetical protein
VGRPCYGTPLTKRDHENNLALIRPIIRIVDYAGTHGVLLNVFPFFAHAFITAQDVIKKALLPDLPAGFSPTVFLRQNLLQHCDPATEHELFVATDKQMAVVRNNNITSASDFKFGSLLSKLDKGGMRLVGREDFLTTMSAKSDKVNGRVVSLKNFIESRRTTTEFSGGHDFRLAESSAILQFTSKTAHSAVATPQCARF